MPNVASAVSVSRDELLAFLTARHKGIFAVSRGDGRPQLSPVSCGVDPEGRIVVSNVPTAREDEKHPPRPRGQHLHSLR